MASPEHAPPQTGRPPRFSQGKASSLRCPLCGVLVGIDRVACEDCAVTWSRLVARRKARSIAARAVVRRVARRECEVRERAALALADAELVARLRWAEAVLRRRLGERVEPGV